MSNNVNTSIKSALIDHLREGYGNIDIRLPAPECGSIFTFILSIKRK